jgi:hypothetical protein
MGAVGLQALTRFLRFAFAAAALLAPISPFVLPQDPETESPQRPEITALEVVSLERATPGRVAEVVAPVGLPRAAVSAPTAAPRLGELDPDAHTGTEDQLRWSLGHGTTSSLH